MRFASEKLLQSIFIRNLFLLLGYFVPVTFVAWYLRRRLVFDKKLTGEVVFCLSRTAFDKDIDILRSDTPLSFIVLDRSYTVAQFLWFPLEMQVQTYFSTFKGRKYDRALKKSQKLFDLLIDYIEKTNHIDAIFSANFDYWQEAGLFQAAVEREKKVVILSREHAIDQKATDEVIAWYSDTQFKFDKGKILVAGSSTKDILVHAGVCNGAQILETGLPRFDPWIGLTPLAGYDERRKNITLMSFAFGYYADETFKNVVKNFVCIGKKYQDTDARFVIKSKDMGDTRRIEAMLSYSERLCVEITHDISIYELLLNSKVVVGYNSLVLVEAVLAKCPIILPAWGQCKDEGYDVIYSRQRVKESSLVDFCYSEDELQKRLEKFVTGSIKFEPNDTEIMNFVRGFISFDLEMTSAEKIYSEFTRH